MREKKTRCRIKKLKLELQLRSVSLGKPLAFLNHKNEVRIDERFFAWGWVGGELQGFSQR